MMFRKQCYVISFSLLVLVAGCGHDRPDERAAPARSSASSNPAREETVVTEYKLKGVVKRVETELEHVTIAHEAIPGFMDAMRMRFAYKDKSSLAALRPGDLVEGTLKVERALGAVRNYELSGLRVLQHAPAVPSVPDISRNKALAGPGHRLLEVGDPVPDFTMTNQDGQAVKLSDLRGHVVALTFIYTRCPLPDFCPLMDKKFAELAQRIAAFADRASQIRLISLSFDPEHDTPEVLKKHAQIRGAIPPLWTYAVASHAELAKIGGPVGLFYQPGDTEIAHNLCTAVIDRDGNLARLEIGTERNKWDSTDLRKTLYSLLPPSAK
jgi:protein SCO1/2